MTNLSIAYTVHPSIHPTKSILDNQYSQPCANPRPDASITTNAKISPQTQPNSQGHPSPQGHTSPQEQPRSQSHPSSPRPSQVTSKPRSQPLSTVGHQHTPSLFSASDSKTFVEQLRANLMISPATPGNVTLICRCFIFYI